MEQGKPFGLGLIDRLVLLGAWLVSCAAVYGLGFYTGNHAQDRVAAEEERIVRLPVTADPPPAGQRPKPDDDLTFWDALESSGPRIKPGENIPARPAPVAAIAPTGAPSTASANGRRAGGSTAPAKKSTKSSAKPTTKAATTKPSVAATATKRAPAPTTAKTVPAKAVPAKVATKPATGATKASAPAATAKRPAAPAPARAAPPAKPSATAGRTAPPRKERTVSAREARAAAD
jgi:hypothetical protein